MIRQEYETPKIILCPIMAQDVITTSGSTDKDYTGEWDPIV